MQVTTHGVGNYCCGNGRDDGVRSSRGKHHLHLKTPTSPAYIEEPGTNDDYFSSKWDDLLGSLGIGKYGGSGEHSFEQSRCSANFSGVLLAVGSKMTEMNYRERKSRLVARRARENINVVEMVGEKYYEGADYDGLKKEVFSPNCQMILPGTTLEHLS